jgi:hypothetical protein
MMIPNVPPVCLALDCKKDASVLSKQGDNLTYMKTCCRHSYKDIVAQNERNRNNK